MEKMQFFILGYSTENLHSFIFCKFSMLFNGKFAFCQFSMLFNGNLRLDGRKDRRTEGWTDGNSPLCLTGHRPFGAAAQKGWQARKIEG